MAISFLIFYIKTTEKKIEKDEKKNELNLERILKIEDEHKKSLESIADSYNNSCNRMSSAIEGLAKEFKESRSDNYHAHKSIENKLPTK